MAAGHGKDGSGVCCCFPPQRERCGTGLTCGAEPCSGWDPFQKHQGLSKQGGVRCDSDRRPEKSEGKKEKGKKKKCVGVTAWNFFLFLSRKMLVLLQCYQLSM